MDDTEEFARRIAASKGENPDAVVRDGYFSHHSRFDGLHQHRHWVETDNPLWMKYLPLAHSLVHGAGK